MLFNCSVCTFFENRHKDGEKWGKMGKEFYGESILRLAIFPIFPHWLPPTINWTFLIIICFVCVRLRISPVLVYQPLELGGVRVPCAYVLRLQVLQLRLEVVTIHG